ncbi:hypothetical protein [Streptomyces triculaminicus]|uniref:hypothetical protein n=1 Tax=Streptomyces triculaminicus TaxID=2816232 RepID=UPI0037AF17FB
MPFITAWSLEQPPEEDWLVAHPNGFVAYHDEKPHYRDEEMVLWVACRMLQGHGEPELGRVHPRRQKVAMEERLCQMCAEPADQNEQGVLWLLDGDMPREGAWTTQPPVCRACVPRVVRACPALRRSFTLLRVKHPVVEGVHGRLYQPAPGGGLVPGKKRFLRYGDPLTVWMVAGQLYSALHGLTQVALEELASDDGHLNTACGAPSS